MTNEARVRSAVSEAVDALNRELDRVAATSPRSKTVLDINRAKKAPRAVEWCVITDGVIVASSQPHLVGRRRTA